MHRVELVSPILRTDLAFTGDVTYEFLAIDLPNMTLGRFLLSYIVFWWLIYTKFD